MHASMRFSVRPIVAVVTEPGRIELESGNDRSANGGCGRHGLGFELIKSFANHSNRVGSRENCANTSN